jgi:hypothetical protein
MRRLDLLDHTFGRLKVIEFSHANGKHLYWKCACSCGNASIQCTTNLNQGKVVSCGCFKAEISSINLKNIPIVKFQRGVASFNVLFSQYRMGAKRRGIEFLLTKEQFKIFTEGNCFYCDRSPLSSISRRRVNGSYKYNGIDRKDSDGSYTYDNCLSCCGTCNKMKMNLSYHTFLEQIKKIYENLHE